VDDFQQRIENWRAAYHSYATERSLALNDRIKARDSQSSLGHYLCQQLEQGGKRIRPLLLLASHWAMGGPEKPERETLSAAFALECFHTFLLVHDDVIDRSSSRRNRPTLHVDLEQTLTMNPKNASNLAIILGDILYSASVEALLDVSSSRLKPLLSYFTGITEQTGLGEAMEILAIEQGIDQIQRRTIETIYELKTSLYTFEAPLRMSAILHGVDDSSFAPIQKFAQSVGLAFQILNDLHEITLPREEFGKLAYDFHSGVKTLYLYELYLEIPPTDQERLKAILSQKKWLKNDIDFLHQLVHSTQAFRQQKEQAKCLLKQGKELLLAHSWESETAKRLEKICEFIFSNTQHSENTSV